PLAPPKEGNKKTPPKEANKKTPPSKGNKEKPPSKGKKYASFGGEYSPPLEGLGVVSEELKAVFRCVFLGCGNFSAAWFSSLLKILF
ncbi:MAG: hypothetical protein LBC74_11180, partial [Planctomycetaceae bacterium]|nr:hypothetical protein [Planctomycetaceae bacterium]